MSENQPEGSSPIEESLNVSENGRAEPFLGESLGPLTEASRFFAETLDALSSHIAVLDEQGVIVHVNMAWRRFAVANGLQDDAYAVGRNYLEACIPSEDGCIEDDAIGNGIRLVLVGRADEFSCEYPCHSPDRRRWFVMRVNRFTRSGPVRVVVAHDDITERVLADEALRESEARFRFLSRMDEATRGLQVPERVMETASRLLGEYLGVSRCAYAEVEDDDDRFTIRHDYFVEGTKSTVGDYRLDLFGSRAVAELRAGRTYAVRDIAAEMDPIDGGATFASIGINAIVCCSLVKEGRLKAMMAVHQDVARDWTDDEVDLVESVADRSWAYIERARTNRELQEREARLRVIVESTPDCVKLLSSDGTLLEINPAGLRMLEAGNAQDVLGQSIYDVIAEEHREAFREFNGRVCRGTSGSLEFEIVGLRGTRLHMETQAVPLLDAKGRMAHLAITRDISARKRAEVERERLFSEAQRARDEAQAANRMKDEFLAILSHELRTPLNAILGWARILKSGPVDEEDLEEGIAAIERNSTAQAQIIEDLLDVSRIVSGNFKLEVQRVNIQEIIEAAVATVIPAAAAKEIRIHKLLDSLVGPVSGDPARIQQIVWNLAANAVKFTPKGGKVQVLLERVNSHIEISVVDTGIGIRPEFLSQVFDRFRQADSSTTRRHGGLGLGLAIVKQLVEIHGGTVRVKSPGEGQGSTFTVTLPITVIHPERLPEEKTRPKEREGAGDPCKEGTLSGVRVLVLDDESDARLLIRRVLKGCEAEVALASSAREGLELVDRFRPHVIVSDVGMPEMDGYDFIRRVRVKWPSSLLPAAALTAFARSEDRRQALLAGFQTHVVKPVDPAELVAVVASLAGRTETA